ncbi:hypothetical protein [Streptomyces griseus]|uniref:hypothetical protein n=1 Tax=Streptomyces griseus TaxID=1911 RepID=UPI00364BEB7B
MTDTPMTPDTALARLRQYGERTSTWSTATYNDGTEKALHQIAVSLAGEVERLRSQLQKLESRDSSVEYGVAWPDGTLMRETPTPSLQEADARLKAHREMGGSLADSYLVQRMGRNGEWLKATP